MARSFLLVGAGSMGGAMLRRWLEGDAPPGSGSAVIEPNLPSDLAALCDARGVAVNPRPGTCAPDILVFAVKPQMAADVLPPMAGVARRAVTVSVMAGVSTASLARLLDGADRLVRAMPNLPAQFGEGITGVYASPAVALGDRKAVAALLGEVGEVVWVEQEAGVDAVTALSGSGPAYFFLMAEALAEAGRELGLPESAATQLARATLAGAGAVVKHDPRSVTALRAAVTSPGGTTAAALGVFDGEGRPLRTLARDAMRAAYERALQLST